MQFFDKFLSPFSQSTETYFYLYLNWKRNFSLFVSFDISWCKTIFWNILDNENTRSAFDTLRTHIPLDRVIGSSSIGNNFIVFIFLKRRGLNGSNSRTKLWDIFLKVEYSLCNIWCIMKLKIIASKSNTFIVNFFFKKK